MAKKLESYGKAPRSYDVTDVDHTFHALVQVHVQQQKSPTFGEIAAAIIGLFGRAPRDRAGVSQNDVWFICRDELRDRLGLIEWDAKELFLESYVRPRKGVHLTQRGMEAAGVKLVGTRYVTVGSVEEALATVEQTNLLARANARLLKRVG